MSSTAALDILSQKDADSQQVLPSFSHLKTHADSMLHLTTNLLVPAAFSCRTDADVETIHSVKLQQIVDYICTDELYGLDFSVAVTDPTMEDCPLIACSIGFSELTGYSIHEIIGRNCRFLLNGVPQELQDLAMRQKARNYCIAAHQDMGLIDQECSSTLPTGLQQPWVKLPRGDCICVQTNAKKSGELFKNMFYLRGVELDDKAFVVGLQARLPEDFGEDAALNSLKDMCRNAFMRLHSNMNALDAIFASKYWFSAPMRRSYW